MWSFKNIFNEFSSKKNKAEAAVNVIYDIFSLQINLAKPDDNNELIKLLITPISLGYIFGFIDGMLQGLHINDMDTQYEVLETVMILLIGEDKGRELAVEILNLQHDEDFAKTREIGGKQAVAFLRKKLSPMGLSHILNEYPLDTIYGQNGLPKDS